MSMHHGLGICRMVDSYVAKMLLIADIFRLSGIVFMSGHMVSVLATGINLHDKFLVDILDCGG